MVKVNVSCPVCTKVISYEHAEAEAWGTMSVWDYGIVEITGHDKGAIAAHKNSHSLAEWAEAQKRHADQHGAQAAKSLEVIALIARQE